MKLNKKITIEFTSKEEEIINGMIELTEELQDSNIFCDNIGCCSHCPLGLFCNNKTSEEVAEELSDLMDN